MLVNDVSMFLMCRISTIAKFREQFSKSTNSVPDSASLNRRPFSTILFYVSLSSLSSCLSSPLPLSPEAARHRNEARRWSDKGARHVHPSCTGRLFIPEVKSVAAEAVWTSRRTKSTNFGHRLLARYIRVATAPRRAIDDERDTPFSPNEYKFRERNQIGLLRR